MSPRVRIELTTDRLEADCSRTLSYESICPVRIIYALVLNCLVNRLFFISFAALLQYFIISIYL